MRSWLFIVAFYAARDYFKDIKEAVSHRGNFLQPGFTNIFTELSFQDYLHWGWNFKIELQIT